MKPKLKKKIARVNREAEIGARLKAIREKLKLRQAEFAERVGIRRERLASYETGRVPIPCEIALEFCRVCNVNQQWLATGVGAFFPFVPINMDTLPRKPLFGEPFSAFYDTHIEGPVLDLSARLFPKSRWTFTQGGPADYKKYVHESIDFCFGTLPEEEWEDFAGYISGIATDYQWARERARKMASFTSPKKV